MMDDSIGDLTWAACYICKHGLISGDCEIDDTFDFSLDCIAEIVTCDNYEPHK